VPSLAGTTIDKYEMIEEVGCGGMAVVYRGRDRVLDREVAVKVLHPHLADREESRLRLQREAIAVAKLRHDNILEIFDYSGPSARESYIVTEFIHGPTLKEWIDESLQPRPAVAAMIVHRLCLALAHAHKSAIVHRDIKPENVMIRMQDGVIKLMDFGIAQIIDNQKLTLTGQLIGSPAYMAPELISGKPLDARTDLFSLGILLYQLATGELPFSGRNPHEVLNRIADGEYPAPSTICPLVDRELEAIIERALATNPDDRYQSVETLGHELEEYCLEVGIEPSGEELAKYFTDPDGYVVELDERVCGALMAQAEEAAKTGSTARAIRLLGRVVELQPEHKGAKSLLAKLRVRERRVRHLLVAAGGLAIAGLATAGYMLIEPDGGQKAAALAGGSVLEPPAPIGPPVGEADDEGPGEAEGEREDSAAADDAADDASAAVVPAAEGATAEPEVETGEDTDAARPNGKRTPTRVASPKPTVTSCKLKIEKVPLSTARWGLPLKIGQKSGQTKTLDYEFTFSGESVSVRLDDERYRGSVEATPAACAAGPISLVGKPRDAKLSFSGIPATTAVAWCDGSCKVAKRSGFIHVDRDLSIPMEEGQHERDIELWFKHEDFKEKTMHWRANPGAQKVEVTLEPR
jgi:tRNA A-37 threonylcarbamoyl transferase component Bud32